MFEQAVLPERRSALRQWFKVVGPRGLKRLNFISLGDKVESYWVHWDTTIRRSVPCIGVGTCEICRTVGNRRWQGYLCATSLDTRSGMVVEVTEGCARKMKDAGHFNKSLRGLQFVLYRKPESNRENSAVYFTCMNDQPKENLPAAFDIMPSLLRMWGWNEENAEFLAAQQCKKKRTNDGPRTIVTGEVPY